MLSENERAFLRYWEANRLKERKVYKQLLIGLPIGLLFAVPVLVILFSGRFWYQRANMAMNSTNPVVLIVAVVAIAVFMAIFYKRHQWEMREQQYLSLKAREEEGE